MVAAVTNNLCRLLLACALALSSVGFGSSTTTASAAAFTYDAKVVARVDIHASEVSLAERSQFTGLQGRFTSRGFSAPGTPTNSSVSFVATEAVPGIKTPYGVAEQGTDAGSIALRGQVESGRTVYRQGVTGTQQTAEGQFWAGQNPASTPGYANSYGTQVAQGEYPWIMGGTVESGTPFVTRGAPDIGTNLGGAPEVVVNPGGVRNLWFHMPD